MRFLVHCNDSTEVAGCSGSQCTFSIFVKGSQPPTKLSGLLWNQGYATTDWAFLTEKIQHYSHESKTWQDVSISEPGGGAIRWGLFYREFVADIGGEGSSGYPTFHDGWVANEIIEIVQQGKSWAVLPEQPASSGNNI